MNPWFEPVAVAISAISGVLAARGQRLDLFGILVLALVTAVGGGTIRDLCLGVRPVFWVQDPTHLVTAGVAALAMFVLARFWEPPAVTLQVADAFGLALFTIVGVEKSLLFQASPVTAVVLGVVTGVAGGLLRDVLRREVPLVFQPETYFYATAAFAGAVLFVLLTRWVPDVPGARPVSMAVILLLRLAALGWKWKLPVFTSRQS